MSSPWTTHEPAVPEPTAQPETAVVEPEYEQPAQPEYEPLFGRAVQPTEYGPQVAHEPQPIKADTPYRNAARKIFGPLIAAGAAVIKFGAILLKLKVVTVAATMIVSIGAYALLGGWWFGVGLVALIFVHEMGHAVELRRQGIPATAPLFIPFLGAMIGMKGRPADAWKEAQVALAGPLLGTVGAAAVWGLGAYYDSNFLRALAFVGFFINLFNLLPVVPLDGGRAMAALHPAIWFVGLLALIAIEILKPTPLLPIIIALGGYELWRRWRSRNDPENAGYYKIKGWQRIAVAVTYFGLAALLVLAMHATHVPRNF